jgi:hypothetical protein
MVNTRSGAGVEKPAVNRPRRAPQQAPIDPAMQQFLEAQTQLLVDGEFPSTYSTCYTLVLIMICN